MPYYADLSNDLPAPYKRKRVIFYRQGLKIYGLLPYILQRKLKAQFFSGTVSWGNVRISAGSLEENWTAVSYASVREYMDALLDWLSSDPGFEVAIASRDDWEDSIFSANVFRYPPKTWYPMDGEIKKGFLQIVEKPDIARNDIVKLLALPAEKKE